MAGLGYLSEAQLGDIMADAAAAAGVLVTSFNSRDGAVTLTSGDVTTALTFTPQPLDATLTDVAGRNIGAAASTDILDRAAGDVRYALVASAGVSSFNTRTGAVTLTSADVAAALGFVPPDTLFDHYATVGNTATDETTLYTDTISAGKLAANGDKLTAEYGGSFVSSGTATRQVRIYFAETLIFDTGALTLSLSSAWTAYVSIIRVSSTVIRYMTSFATQGAALAAYTSVGELTGLTLSNTAALKITGTAAGVGAASNDILAKLGSISFYPAA